MDIVYPKLTLFKGNKKRDAQANLLIFLSYGSELRSLTEWLTG